MERIITIIFIMLSTVSISLAQKKVVIETTLGNGVEESLKSIFMSALSTGMTNSGQYTVLTNRQEYANKLSGEIEAQSSGLISDDQLADFGNAYGADMVVYVKIDSFDQDYFITVSMFNVETGVADKTVDPILTTRQEIVRSAYNLAKTITSGGIGEAPKVGKSDVYAANIEGYIDSKNHEPVSFEEAYEACKQKGEGWRLPTIQELEKLYYGQLGSLSLYGSRFNSTTYWTSTKRNNFSIMAIDFGTGHKTYISTTTVTYYRCVYTE